MTTPRNTVPVERTWDEPGVFSTVEAWEAELEAVLADLPALAAFQGRLGESASVLVEALHTRDELARRAGRVFVYAMLGYAVETTDPAAVARSGRAQAAEARVTAATAFVDPEVLALGEELLHDWSAAEPAVVVYEHHVADLVRRAGHMRSAEVEEVLGLVSDAFSGPFTVYSALVDSDVVFTPAAPAVDGEPIEVTQGSIDALLASPDRTLRRSAWESYADGYLGVRNALAANLASTIKQAVFSTRVRRHASPLAASLSASNVPVEVFDNLIAAFEANLPTWHRYWRVRRTIHGVEELAPYDVAAPLGASSPVLPYEQCVEWICASLAPLGDAYLAWQSQPQVYSRYSIFVAEGASNFHQALLRAHLFDTVDDRALQLAVLEEAMANFYRYFFVMPTLARLERELHERVDRGEGLTAELLGERTADLFAEGFGPDVELDRERVGITWAQFAHLYEPFYVYQYATGISGAHALARGVLDGETGAAERYLEFLSAGDSVYPLDALRRAGVDLTSSAPVEEAFAVLAALVDRIEQLA